MIVRSILLSSLAIFSLVSMKAQVVINEYSASNLHSYTDGFGKTEDWIELYNMGDEFVDISGYHLSDKESKPGKWEIPEGVIMFPKSHMLFSCSGRDGIFFNHPHTNFKLSQTKGSEGVLLSDQDENIINYFPLELTLVEHSRCRVSDGADEWMVCTQTSYGFSNDQMPKFDGYTNTPSMSLEAGYYSGPQEVNIINNEPGAVLRYTTNGDNPTLNSAVYTSPIQIDKTTVIKAMAFDMDGNKLPGKMDFNTYFIDEDFSLAVFSIASDDVIRLAHGNGDLIPIGSLEYFNKDKVREATAFGDLNRHGQDSWVLNHRSLDWVSRDEMGYSKAVEAKLFGYSDRDSYQKFMFRNSGDDNYPAINDHDHIGSTHIRDEYVQTLAYEGGMKLDHRAVERVIVFLNGEYWGVYGMRERAVDHDFTKEYYDQGKYEIQYLSTWGNTTIEYGGDKAWSDWVVLRDKLLNSDLSLDENYKIAEDSINLVSMIDYFLVNLNVVASDWLNYNTAWWRGLNPDGDHKKWGYMLWDLDATFDYYINYSGVPDISPNAKPCDLEEIGDFMDMFFNFYGNTEDVGQHEKILLKLLDENDTFKQLYFSRYADIMNTVYTCENMMTTLDSMLAVIEPEMPKQIARWGGTMEEWKQNVDDLKGFIAQRCQRLDDGAVSCYEEITDVHSLTLMAIPEEIGEIDLNTLDIENFPWTGDYFEGVDNIIKANVFNEYEDDYEFSHWISSANNLITPDITSIDARLSMIDNDTLTAVFREKLEGTVSTNETIIELDEFEIFPNPTSGDVSIQYSLNTSAEIEVDLYNLQGQKLFSFSELSQTQAVGRYNHTLRLPSSLGSGLYLLTMNINGKRQNAKVSLIR